MDNDLINSINMAKELILNQVNKKDFIKALNFSEYCQGYFFTNEKIMSYLNIIDFTNKEKALTVLSSGDHVFNLISKNILNIDSFDINKLSEYNALGIKRSMILKYNYNEFLNVTNKLLAYSTSLEELSDIITGLLPFMESKHKFFWSKIIGYNYVIQRENRTNLNLIDLLCFDINIYRLLREKILKETSYYLLNEEEYNKLKVNLYKANITFKSADARNLGEEFKGNKYDVIMLSNILTYFGGLDSFGYNWEYDKLLNYEKNLELICNDDAIIFLLYLFNYFDEEMFLPINYGLLDKRDLTDEQIIKLSNVTKEAILLKRVKGDKNVHNK